MTKGINVDASMSYAKRLEEYLDGTIEDAAAGRGGPLGGFSVNELHILVLAREVERLQQEVRRLRMAK